MRIRDLEPFEAESLPEVKRVVDSLRRQSACPPFRHLRAARAELLPEELQAEVTRHIAGCKACASIQVDLDTLPEPAGITQEETRRILSRIHGESRKDKQRSALRWVFSWRAVSVTAALALCTVIVVLQIRKTPRPVPGQGPAVELAEALKIDKPDVKLTLAVLTWRAEKNTGQQFLADLTPALDLYKADRFADAARQFDVLSAKYSGSVEVFFYLGVSRLFLGDPGVAIQALEKADGIAPDSFAADVSWYLALAYQRSGRIADAHARLTSLADGNSAYATRARAALEALKNPAFSR
jgi:hypothetical protein